MMGDNKMKKKISISGMSCMHCVHHVTEALNEVKGVSNVEVNLDGKFANINADSTVNNEAIKSAIADAGYEVTGIIDL
jgi:copper ion binding protein